MRKRKLITFSFFSRINSLSLARKENFLLGERKMEKSKRNTLITVIASLMLVAVLFVVYGLILPKTDKGEKNVTLEINYADASYSYEVTTNGEHVYDLLNEYDETLELSLVAPESAYGRFIESIKNTPQDVVNGYYYVFKINGEYSNFGISTQAIKDGDTITFEYGTQNYDENFTMLSTTLASGGDESVTKTPLRTGNIVLIVVGGVAFLLAIGTGVYLLIKSKKE